MGGWMEAQADKVHKQGKHIPQHCYISHNQGFRNLFKFLVSALFCYALWPTHCRSCTCGRCIIRARALTKWHPTANTLCPTIKKCWSYVAVTLKTKCKSTTLREFHGYWMAVSNATLFSLRR